MILINNTQTIENIRNPMFNKGKHLNYLDMGIPFDVHLQIREVYQQIYIIFGFTFTLFNNFKR